MIARLDLPPEMGAHTTFPMMGMDVPNFKKCGPAISKRDFLVIVGETTDNECHAPQQMMHIFDITMNRKFSAFRRGMCPSRAAISAAAAGASARTRSTKT